MVGVKSFDEAAVITAFASSVVFVLGYTLISPWWRSLAGRAMVSLDVGLLITLLPATLHYVLKYGPGQTFFSWYYGCSLFLVSGITLWRLLVLWRIQTDGAARRRKKINNDLS